MNAPSLSLILPCYNEESNIESTVAEAVAWFDQEGIEGEIIAVEDGSRDATRALLQKLSAGEPRLRVVCHDINRGYGLAIRSGCDAARMEALAFVDSDGQFRIRDLGLLLPHLETHAFVTGRRRKRADSFLRNMLGKVLGVANLIWLRLWVRDVNCGMKAFKRSLWASIRPVHGVEKLFNTEMFLRLHQQGIVWKQVDVPHFPRRAGNPTGAKLYVIRKMFTELQGLRNLAESGRRTAPAGPPVETSGEARAESHVSNGEP